MVLFEGYDEKGALCSEYGLFDMGDGAMDTVSFNDVIQRGETELHYLFDLRNNRFIKLVFEGEVSFSPMRSYPYLSEEKGQNPDQFRARYEEAPVVPTLRPHRDTAKFDDPEDDLDDDFDDEDDCDDDDDKIFDGEEMYGDDDS